MGHQIFGTARNGCPGGATILTDLQVALRLLGDTHVNRLRGTVSVLALGFVEHYKADAVHIGKAVACRRRKRNLVNTGPGLAVVGTLVEALGAATTKEDIRLVRVHSQFFAGLAAHAVAVGEHFHIAGVPGRAVIFAAEHCSPSITKVPRSGQHVNTFRVRGVQRKGLRTVKPLVVFRDEIHQGNPGLRRKVETVDAAHVGAGVKQVFLLRVEYHGRHESAAVKADITPFVFFHCKCLGTKDPGQGEYFPIHINSLYLAEI